MSMQIVHIIEMDVERCQLGNTYSTEYSIENGNITFYWKDKVSSPMRVKVGDVLIAKCGGGLPEVNRVIPPRNNADLVLWALGFSQPVRAHTYADYQAILVERTATEDWEHLDPSETYGYGYSLALGNRPYYKGAAYLCGYIDRTMKVDKPFVLGILRNWHHGFAWPESFIRKVFASRFGFTEADWAKLGKKPAINIPASE